MGQVWPVAVLELSFGRRGFKKTPGFKKNPRLASKKTPGFKKNSRLASNKTCAWLQTKPAPGFKKNQRLASKKTKEFFSKPGLADECHGFGDGPNLTGSCWEVKLGFGVWLPPPGGSQTPKPNFTPQ